MRVYVCARAGGEPSSSSVCATSPRSPKKQYHLSDDDDAQESLLRSECGTSCKEITLENPSRIVVASCLNHVVVVACWCGFRAVQFHL